jgi:hypothetical protein
MNSLRASEKTGFQATRKKTELRRGGFRERGDEKDARALRCAVGGSEASADAGEISTEFCQELGTIRARKNYNTSHLRNSWSFADRTIRSNLIKFSCFSKEIIFCLFGTRGNAPSPMGDGTHPVFLCEGLSGSLTPNPEASRRGWPSRDQAEPRAGA